MAAYRLGVGARVVLTFISLTGWDTFQHYKDRDPPWIKLYRDILTTESWVLGTDTSRLVQVASMLLAVRYKNRIPLNWPLLKKVASLDCSEKQFMEAIQHLAASNFLTIEKDQEVTSTSEGLLQPASTVLATCPSETDQIRDRSETDQIRSPLPPKGGADAVFEHWKLTWGHPGASLDVKRRRRIEARLKKFSVTQVCDAVAGFRNSPWHCGTDPKGEGTVYDGIDTLLRDDAQVEKGLRLLAHPPRPPPKSENATERILRALNGTNNSRTFEHEPEREFPALTR